MKYYYFLLLTAMTFSAMAEDNGLDCEQALTTPEINRCAGIELDAAEIQLHQYLQGSLDERYEGDPELQDAIRQAQIQWEAYRDAHCDAVYGKWRDGTIRGVMATSCKTRLTQQRTHELWRNFLTYMDSTPPVLSEPAR